MNFSFLVIFNHILRDFLIFSIFTKIKLLISVKNLGKYSLVELIWHLRLEINVKINKIENNSFECNDSWEKHMSN